MKITKMTTTALAVPLKYPVGSANQKLRKFVNPVIVELTTDEGVDGFGIAFAYNNYQVKSLKYCIDDLEDIIIGQNIFRWAEAWQKLFDGTKHMGHRGYGIYALSAIDSAIWVLKSKALQVPLSHLLGGYRERVPAYASYLLFRNWSIEELKRDAADLKALGFQKLKMNMGDKSFKEEIERYEAVKETVGEDVDILVDVNWAWGINDAIKMGQALAERNVYWLEDPLTSEDLHQLSILVDRLDVPIAVGETFSTKHEFRRILENNAADVLIVDIQRVGGISEWMKVATLAQAWNLPIASHIFNDFSVHLVAAVPNGLIVEYMPWWDKIYINPPEVKDGYMEVPKKPGVGFDLNREAMKRFEIKNL
jgi:L-alanine-DL-glutamate epimerase-like enolase superfamily enzyme